MVKIENADEQNSVKSAKAGKLYEPWVNMLYGLIIGKMII